MSRQNMASPISILVGGVIVIILLLASSGVNTSAIALQQNGTPTWTPCDDTDSECIDFQDNALATSESLTETADAYPARTSSGYTAPSARTSVITGTQTITGVANGTSTTPTTPTTTLGTPTPTATIQAGTTSSAQPSSEAQPNSAIPTPSPTPVDAIICTPGVAVEITGAGPARAPLLLYFGERAVGGGSVAPNGRFALKLLVGQERAGEYQVTVRVRGTSQELRTITCSVPNAAPPPRPSPLGR